MGRRWCARHGDGRPWTQTDGDLAARFLHGFSYGVDEVTSKGLYRGHDGIPYIVDSDGDEHSLKPYVDSDGMDVMVVPLDRRCPHCGSDHLEVRSDIILKPKFRYAYHVECMDCGARGPRTRKRVDGNLEAWELWDNRVG